MSKRMKNLIIISAIAAASLIMALCLFKVFQAPAVQAAKEFVYSQLKTEKTLDAPVAAAPESESIEFIFGGDVMLSRQVNKKMAAAGNYSWPFLKIADFLKSADFTVVNLEGPFAISKDYAVSTGSLSFKVNPVAVEGLLSAGIDLVSLANNHSFNQGAPGLLETFKVLTERGIKYVGAGRNEEEAHRGEIVLIKGKKFGFWAYAYPNDNSVAGEKKAGIANLDVDKMRSDVARLKAQGATVIVLMHAGTEYTAKPNQQQITFARAAIEAGAEAVIGHHPHWPQTFEFYQGKPIIYSLGNLVFDQMWSKATRQGIIAKMSWQDGWQRIELVPIKIQDYGQASIIPDGAEKKEILEKIGAPDDGVIDK